LNYEVECWNRRLLQTRYRGPQGREALRFLGEIRDRVLELAQLRPGDFVLDVGSGDGLLAFGALQRVGHAGLVIVDDIAADVLAECRKIAETAGAVHRMQFVQNDATDLRDLPDASIDAVLTRSVLLYVEDKGRAAAEFRRVLRSGGRISLFEPIGRVAADSFRFGIDPGPVADLAARVEQELVAHRLPETDSMLDFDERDLLRIFSAAGFSHLDLELHVKMRRERKNEHWFESMLDGTTHPNVPTLRQIVASALSDMEAEAYLSHYMQAAATDGVTSRQAFIYLSGGID
jgi:arsenite methyltransferase